MPFIGVLSSNDIWTTLLVDFEVCGYETVTRAINETIYRGKNDLKVDDSDHVWNLQSLFTDHSRDNFCIVDKFTLTLDDESEEIISSSWTRYV